MNQQWLASVDMSLAFAVSPVAACLLLLVLGICSTSTENTTEVSGSGSATGGAPAWGPERFRLRA